MLYSTHDSTFVVFTPFSRVGPCLIMNIRYLFVVILFAAGGILVGQSILTSNSGQNSVNILGIVLGAICLIIAVVLLIRAPIKR